MKTVYLQKHEPRLVQVIKITNDIVAMASLKVAQHSAAKITPEILEYIPKSNALEYLVRMQETPVESDDSIDDIADAFIQNGFSECDHYPFAQIQAHYIETPDNNN